MAVLEVWVGAFAGYYEEIEDVAVAVVALRRVGEGEGAFVDESADAIVVEADYVDRFVVVADLEGEVGWNSGSYCGYVSGRKFQQ